MTLATTVGRTPPDTAAWDALCDELRATPFQRPGWLLAWYAAFAPKDAWYVQAFDCDRLVGVLPLRRRFGITRSPTNWHTPLFASVATGAAVESALVGAAIGNTSALGLRFVPEHSATAAAFHDLGAGGAVSVRSRPLLRSPRVDIDRTWDEYEQSLSKSLLKTIRRRARRLEELGRVDVEVVTEVGLARERLEEGLALETAGWKGRSGTAITAQARVHAFYVEMALDAARAGRLSLAFLRLDDRAIAFHLDLVDDRVLYGLKGTYAEDLASMSPSRILRHERIKQAFGNDLRAYEFLGADEPYKSDWSNGATELVALDAYPRSPAGRLIEIGNTRGRTIGGRLHRGALAARRRAAAWRGRES